MIETISHPEDDTQWLALARGETSDWHAVLDPYQSTVDWPGIMIWQELMQANPDAGIILTVRDPESWYESASATIFKRMRDFIDLAARDAVAEIDPARALHMQMIDAVVVQKSFGGSLEREHAISIFKAHNEEVRRAVPPEKLLIYESGEGWEPLCAFLGVPVPEIPYPKVNTPADFATRFPARR